MSDEFANKLYGFRRQLLAIGISLTGNYSDSEDLVQMTIIRAIQYQDTFTGGNLFAWAVTILKNLHIDETRSAWQRLRDNNISHEEVIDVVGYDADAERTVELRQVLAVLAEIGNNCRELLILCAYGYKTREIADSLNMPLGTTGRRMMECRQKLYDRINFPTRVN